MGAKQGKVIWGSIFALKICNMNISLHTCWKSYGHTEVHMLVLFAGNAIWITSKVERNV